MTSRTTFVLVALGCLGATACGGNANARAARHLRRADDYAAKHKYAEARIEYLNAVQEQPRSGDAHYRLAKVDSALGRNADALAEFERAGELDSSNIDAQLQAAALLLAAGRFNEAQNRAQLVLNAQPNNLDAQVFLGDALAGLGDVSDAIKQVEAALALNPSYAPAYSALGALQESAGRVADAGRSFDRAVELDPKSVPFRLSQANHRWAAGDRAGAEKSLRSALELDPSNATTHRALARLYLNERRTPQAEAEFRTLASQSGDGVLRLAEFYVAQGRTDQALGVLQQVPKNAPIHRAAQERVAEIEERQGRHAEAMAIANALMHDQPSDADARALRARLELAANDLNGAWNDAHEATTGKAASAPAYYTLGLVAFARRDLDAAQAAFESSLELNPRATASRMKLAEVRLARGDRAHALVDARAAAAGQPDDPESALLLSRILREDGDIADARRQLQAAIERAPANAPIYAELGWLELGARNEAAARAAFGRALRIDPLSESARNGAVAAALAAGDYAGARGVVQDWLAARPGNDGAEVLAAQIDIAQKNLPAAEQRLANVIERSPSRLDAYQLLGSVYLKEGRVDAALAKYREAVKRDPNADAARTLVGIILESTGDREGARAEYQAVLARNPRAAVAANNLAWMLAEDGNLDGALKYASVAVDEMGDRPEGHDTLGWVYLKKQLPGHAETSFQRALELAPQNQTYKAHLTEARAAMRDSGRTASR